MLCLYLSSLILNRKVSVYKTEVWVSQSSSMFVARDIKQYCGASLLRVFFVSPFNIGLVDLEHVKSSRNRSSPVRTCQDNVRSITPNKYRPEIFFYTHFLGPKIFLTLIFLDQHFIWSKNLLNPFFTKFFLDPHIFNAKYFWTQHFFGPINFLEPKFFWTQNLFELKFQFSV